ncbi:hypothetical protein GCM10010360_05700 [Streptomyces nogalater]
MPCRAEPCRAVPGRVVGEGTGSRSAPAVGPVVGALPIGAGRPRDIIGRVREQPYESRDAP